MEARQTTESSSSKTAGSEESIFSTMLNTLMTGCGLKPRIRTEDCEPSTTVENTEDKTSAETKAQPQVVDDTEQGAQRATFDAIAGALFAAAALVATLLIGNTLYARKMQNKSNTKSSKTASPAKILSGATPASKDASAAADNKIMDVEPKTSAREEELIMQKGSLVANASLGGDAFAAHPGAAGAVGAAGAAAPALPTSSSSSASAMNAKRKSSFRASQNTGSASASQKKSSSSRRSKSSSSFNANNVNTSLRSTGGASASKRSSRSSGAASAMSKSSAKSSDVIS